MPYPTKPKAGWQRPRQVVVNQSTVQLREQKATREVCKQIPGHFSEQYGGGTQRASGSIFLSRRRQDVHLPSRGDVAEHTEEPTFQKMQKDCQAEASKSPRQ